MRLLFISAVASLFVAAVAVAQSRPPVAAQSPSPAAAPAPAMLGGTIVSGPALSATPTSVLCLPGKCAGPPCTPEVKPAKKTVYLTVNRDFCVPNHSMFDKLLSLCGLADDCDGPSGETHTKTLLVKKQVPKCEEACATCKTVVTPVATIGVPAVPAKP